MIIIIIIVGLIIRLVSINQSLWLDEATSALVAKMSVVQMFTRFLPGDFHPPFYYLLLKYWVLLFGNSEVVLRLPSVIFGSVTIYLCYIIGKQLFNNRVGTVSALLIATSDLAVYYSQEVRMYSLAMMLVALSFYLFVNKKWLYFSVVLVLVGMTDYVALFMIPVFVLMGWKDIKKIVLTFIPLSVIFLVWFPTFGKQIKSGMSVQGDAWWAILGQPSLKNAALIPVKFILGRISFDDKWLYATIVALVGLLFGYLLLKARQSTKILWYWLLLPIIFGILISFKVPTLSYFRFLFCLPAFYVLISAGLEKAGKYKRVLLCVVLAINILSTFYYLSTPRFQRENWRLAAATIGTDKIILPAATQSEALEYYGKSSQIISPSALFSGISTVWLSRYVQEIADPIDSMRIKIESLGYNKVAEYNFNGVVFWKYSKNLYAHRN